MARNASSALHFGSGLDPGVLIPVLAWSLSTALGVLLFALFLRRPAPRERVARAGAVAAATGATAVEMTVGAVPTRGVSASPYGDAPAPGDAGLPDEANMPRWLRPTLREQRQASDRWSTPAIREPEQFGGPPRKGVERRTIGYRLVRLSDGPDDLRSREIARLDRGDEVEVIGDLGGFLQVRTPSGLEGWVPRFAIVH